jgi:choline-sulfatase
MTIFAAGLLTLNGNQSTPLRHSGVRHSGVGVFWAALLVACWICIPDDPVLFAQSSRDQKPENHRETIPPIKRPLNILFLAVDDMKDWVGCLGGYEGTVQTPNIDQLADKAMLFRNAHCPSPKCAPSRAAIMTGLKPSTSGLYDNGHWWLPNHPDVVTLPAHFRSHGYQVVGAGKIFHHTAGNHPPNQWNDFQRIVFRNDPWFRSSKQNYPWSKSGPQPAGFPFSGVTGLGHENDWGSLNIADVDYDDSRSAQYAIDYLNGQHDQPFFLACGLFRPHLPWYVPAEYFDLYPIDQIRLPSVQADDLDDIPAEGRKLAMDRRSDFKQIKEQRHWKQAIQAYLASISYADAQLGKVLTALDNSLYAQNTIVVLWSDHGWHLGSKGHWHKSTLWEEATRVPLIIDVPGFAAGHCDAPVNLISLFPTLLQLCDQKIPAELDGPSLVPLLKNPETQWSQPAVIEFRRGNAAVRDSRYRYIHYANGGEELYDHATDPSEWQNLANDPAFHDIKLRLSKWLPEKWAKSAATKSQFDFDPATYQWTHRTTGTVTSGSER